MNEQIVKELIKKRKHVKDKLKALKTEIIQSNLELKKAYKPISEPLEKLIENIKSENLPKIKSEKENGQDIIIDKNHPNKSSSPKKKFPLSNSKQFLPTEITFLKDEFLNDSDLPSETFIDEHNSFESTRKDDIINETNLPGYESYLENFHPTVRYYIDKSIKDVSDSFDHYHGIVHNIETDKFKIGDSELDFRDNNVIVHNLTYPATVGLLELLFLKHPQTYTTSDLDNYMDILKRTNAYRKNYDSNEQIHGTTSTKYLTIIKPYLEQKGILKNSGPKYTSRKSFLKPSPPRTRAQTLFKKGGNLMELSNNKIDYIFFDDPNELVNRLRLLIASQSAGHSGLKNEIMSIIEELRELNIII